MDFNPQKGHEQNGENLQKTVLLDQSAGSEYF